MERHSLVATKNSSSRLDVSSSIPGFDVDHFGGGCGVGGSLDVTIPPRGGNVVKSIDWILLAALGAALVSLFAPVADLGYALDAEWIVRDNVRVQEARFGEIWTTEWWNQPETPKSLFRPVTMTVFALVAQFGDGAGAFNVVAILLHILVALVRYRLVLELFGFHEQRRLIAFAATLLAGTHGIVAEGVVGIVTMAEMLAAFFCAVSWLTFTWWMRRPRHGAVWLAISAIMIFLAALAKESAILFAAVPLLHFAFERRVAGEKVGVGRIVLPVIGFGVALAVVMLLRMNALGGIADVERHGVFRDFTTTERVQSGFASTGGLYLPAVLRPDPLIPNVSHQDVPPPTSWTDGRVVLGVLVWSAMAGLLIWGVLRRRVLVACFALLAIVALLPTSNLVIPIGAVAAFRFLYSPFFALAVGLVAGAVALWRWKPGVGYAAAAAVAAIMISGVVGTVRLLPHWNDTASLARYTIEHNPKNMWGQHNHIWLDVLSRRPQPDRQEVERVFARFNEVRKNLHLVPSTGRPDFATRINAFKSAINDTSFAATTAETADDYARARAKAERTESLLPEIANFQLEARNALVLIGILEANKLGAKGAEFAEERTYRLEALQAEQEGANELAARDDVDAKHKARAYLNGSGLEDLLRRPAESRRYLQLAMAAQPNNADVVLRYAGGLVQEGKVRTAFEALESLIDDGVESVTVLSETAKLATKMDKAASARKYRRRLLEVPARSPSEARVQQQVAQSLRGRR